MRFKFLLLLSVLLLLLLMGNLSYFELIALIALNEKPLLLLRLLSLMGTSSIFVLNQVNGTYSWPLNGNGTVDAINWEIAIIQFIALKWKPKSTTFGEPYCTLKLFC